MANEREPVGSFKPVATFTPLGKGPETKKKEKDIQPLNVSAKSRKSGIFKRIMSNFVETDSKTLLDWLVKDQFIPWVKDTCINTLQQIFYQNGNSGVGSPTNKTNYQAYSYKYSVKPATMNEYHAEKERYDYNEIILSTKEEAETVLRAMWKCINEYESASITDLYRLVNVTGNDFQEGNWGWDKDNFQKATWKRISAGYLLILPPVKYLGN